MSEIVPTAPVNQDYLNKRAFDGFQPDEPKADNSKIQGVVLSCMTQLPPTGLFVSATAPEVVLGQILFMGKADPEKKKKGRPWKRRREDDCL